MTSPFTGGKVTLKSETTTITYRGEDFSCHRYYYVCEDTGMEFTDAELDDKGLSEVYEQYRVRHGIPSPESLSSLREAIGIPARTMSIILGLGENQYRLYESGEMPSESIGKMLATLFIPNVMESYLKSSKDMLAQSKYQQAITALHRRKEAVYHVSGDLSFLKMISTSAGPSTIRCSKSRWSDAENDVLYDNIGSLVSAI